MTVTSFLFRIMLCAGVALLTSVSAICANAGDVLDGWVIEPTPSFGYTNGLSGVHAFSEDDAWAVGASTQGGTHGLILHWDGQSWTNMPAPDIPGLDGLTDVHGSDPDNVWAVGWSLENGIRKIVILHWDGSEWSIEPVPDPHPIHNQLNGVFAVSATDVWAVGYEGVWDVDGEDPVAMHWDGVEWTIVPTPFSAEDNIEELNDVLAIDSDNIWAVGSSGGVYEFIMYHYDGNGWSSVSVPQIGSHGRHLHGVVALAPDNIWVAGRANMGGNIGRKGVILNYNGTEWIDHSPPYQFTYFLWDIAAAGPDDILATGEAELPVHFALAYRFDGNDWTYLDLDELETPGTGATKNCAMLPTGEAWAVGSFSPDGGESDTRAYRYVPSLDIDTVTDFEIIRGTHFAGDLSDLLISDNDRLHTRSERGFLATEPNLMEVIIGGTSPVDSGNATTIDLTIESNINHPEGAATIGIRNWSTDDFDLVGMHDLGTPETVETFDGIDATSHVRESDARIEVSIKHVVVAVFVAVGFDSFFDHVEISVE